MHNVMVVMNRLVHMKWALLIVLVCLGYPAAPLFAESRVTGCEKHGDAKARVHITADRLESNHKMKWVEFSGNVTATQDDVIITADRMRVFYKAGEDTFGGADSIEKIISHGNVKIVFDNKTKTAVAENVVYLVDKKVLELSGGHPKVWSGENIVTGKKITLFQAENRSLVEGGDRDQVEATLYVKEGGGLK
ncbi:MAG: lipopolysaccharide transport periplasmic protein LptA [Desulfobacterales bacterium C00003060]|nr:MAG: lipopolysaccharide transport periplasmic protein LptA [Desulfobacterales bacterium C00003060]